MAEKENYDLFMNRLVDWSRQDRDSVDWAYQTAKSAHRDQWREDFERYFEHPRQAALILLDECQIKNPRMIVATLLHDVPEDTAIFGNRTKIDYYTWIDRFVRYRLSRMFDLETAEMVVAVTKPHVDGINILSEKQAEALYFENLGHGSPETILVKMADRLHNLRTQGATSLEKQVRKIKETRNDYFPVFERVRGSYLNEANYLLNQMEIAITKLEIPKS